VRSENCREVQQKSRLGECRRRQAPPPPMCSMPLMPRGQMVSWPMARAVAWRTPQAAPSRWAIARLMGLVE
jgi:hypothetical protein